MRNQKGFIPIILIIIGALITASAIFGVVKYKDEITANISKTFKPEIEIPNIKSTDKDWVAEESELVEESIIEEKSEIEKKQDDAQKLQEQLRIAEQKRLEAEKRLAEEKARQEVEKAKNEAEKDKAEAEKKAEEARIKTEQESQRQLEAQRLAEEQRRQEELRRQEEAQRIAEERRKQEELAEATKEEKRRLENLLTQELNNYYSQRNSLNSQILAKENEINSIIEEYNGKITEAENNPWLSMASLAGRKAKLIQERDGKLAPLYSELQSLENQYSRLTGSPLTIYNPPPLQNRAPTYLRFQSDGSGGGVLYDPFGTTYLRVQSDGGGGYIFYGY